jgi:outer membrane immunogenic protein
MKKLFLCVLAFTSSFAFAGGPEMVVSDPANYNGFYIGIGGGGVIAENNAQSTTILNAPDFQSRFTLPSNWNASAKSGLGAAFLGYGHAFQRLYLGGEVIGSIRGDTNSQRDTNYIISPRNTPLPQDFANTTRIHLNNFEVALDARPGFLLTPSTLIYGKIGAAFNKIHINSFSKFQAAAIDPGSTVTLPYNISRSDTGLRLGVGLEERITAHLSLRGEYLFTDYGKLKNSAIVPYPFDAPTSTLANSTSVKPKTHTILASVSYYF